MYGTILCLLKFWQFIGEWLSGRVLAWGARDRGFDSRFPDHLLVVTVLRGVAQLVARTVRDREVVGSNPAAPTI